MAAVQHKKTEEQSCNGQGSMLAPFHVLVEVLAGDHRYDSMVGPFQDNIYIRFRCTRDRVLSSSHQCATIVELLLALILS